MHNFKFDLVLLAAGRGRRLGNINKAALLIGGKPFLQHLLDTFSQTEGLSQIVITYNSENYHEISRVSNNHLLNRKITLARGGGERVYSVYNALKLLKSSPSEMVVIHDAARPNISTNIILSGLKTASQRGSAVPAIPLVDTIKKVEKNRIISTVPREGIYQIQTPQFFNKRLITYAYEIWFREKRDSIPTDDSYLLENIGISPFIIAGDRENIKVTYKKDIDMIQKNSFIRIGFGYDIHRIKRGGRLYLGGVIVDDTRSAVAHSDGDALLHSICDAMLGGCGLRDIGHFFPTRDKRYKDISSLRLLEMTEKIISKEGYYVINLDSTIVLQTPKIGRFIDKMRENISRILKTHTSTIGIQATTPEGLGEAGDGRAVAAYTVTLLDRRP